VHNFAQIYGFAEDSEKYRQLNDGAKNWWIIIGENADLNKDSRVTRAEWMMFVEIYMDILTERPDSVEYLCHFIGMIFRLIDENGDGTISCTEYSNFLTAWGADTSDAGEIFHKLDTDGDGALRESDMIDLYLQFYQSNDVKSPGNYLFGRAVDEEDVDSLGGLGSFTKVLTNLFKSEKK